MFFICRDKGRRIVVSAERKELITTPQGPQDRHFSSKSIIFKPIAGDGYVTSALPQKGMREKAEGFWESEVAKTRPGLSQEEAENFLANHKDYGVEFVAIGKRGEPLTSGEWSDPVKRSEPYLTPSGDGVYCQLCERQLPNRGLPAHLKAKKHVDLLIAAEESQLPRYVEAE